MTQDEIIEMWNEVIKYAPSEVRIAEFAKLVAQHERRECAKECDACICTAQASEAIRARGQE